MDITRGYIEQELQKYQQLKSQTVTTLNRIDGVIQGYVLMLQHLDKPEPLVDMEHFDAWKRDRDEVEEEQDNAK